MSSRTRACIEAVRRFATPQVEGREELQPLLDRIGDARVVLLGESTHGTRDFYRLRADITRRLICEKGFAAVVVEADWPDALRVNRFVRGWPPGQGGAREGAERALESFTRFPGWMWRNREVLDFVRWLRASNDAMGRQGARAGFYGLDLYASTSGTDVEDVYHHERRFAEPRAGTPHVPVPAEEVFCLEQNARLARNAAAYFDAVSKGQPLSWNLRERHMAETMHALLAHLDATRADTDPPARVVVWVHNSHAGDASATQMLTSGELSLGQIMRRELGEENVVLVGFTTYSGTVLAAPAWGSQVEEKVVRPAHPESFEALFHDTKMPRFSLCLQGELARALAEPRLERAIGAVYLPEAELENHYFYSDLGRQFDFLFHVDETQALEPLDPLPAKQRLRAGAWT